MPRTKKLPGIRDWVYTTSKRDILSYPAVSEAPADLKEAAQTKGDFVLAADKYFYKIGIVKNNGKIEVENQGTDGAKTFLNKITIAIPGTEEEATGLINQMNNDEMVFLVPQRNGKYRIIGNEDFDAELSLKQDTGASPTDSNTTTVEASATDYCAAPFYTGKIHTTDGDIDGATGKIAASTGKDASGSAGTGS